MKRKLLPILLTAVLLAACGSRPSPNKEKPSGDSAASESSPSDPAVSEISITDTDETEDPGRDAALQAVQGTWYDINGDTVLTISNDRMTVTENGHEYTYRFRLAEKYGRYVIQPYESSDHFGVMSDIEIEDGRLTAYDEVLDGDGHNYKFVSEETLAAEKEIRDYSKDLPKTIDSSEITEFELSFTIGSGRTYGTEDWYDGSYSWTIMKTDDGSYEMDMRGMGSSYVMFQFRGEVSEEYVRGLADLIREEGIAGWNGYYKTNNVSLPPYSLNVTYASGEELRILAGGNAADTCVFDLPKLLDYADRQDLGREW
ncbi:MAG: hypothetical protein E7240_10775 [Lachnospiraceae bacterium]|nr:hypothetical protein [Lachnospiraceae bacterium]